MLRLASWAMNDALIAAVGSRWRLRCFCSPLCVFVITFGSLIHSALTLREPVARAQLKWVALGLSSFIVPGIGGWLLGYLGVTSELLSLLSVTGWFLFPICLAIAITRYRLFDIDIIIHRTLVYSVLTGLLALVYFGGVVVLQSVFAAVSGRNWPSSRQHSPSRRYSSRCDGACRT